MWRIILNALLKKEEKVLGADTKDVNVRIAQSCAGAALLAKIPAERILNFMSLEELRAWARTRD
jgi:hypothetical protein